MKTITLNYNPSSIKPANKKNRTVSSLNIDRELLRLARTYAGLERISYSDVVERALVDYFVNLASDENN